MARCGPPGGPGPVAAMSASSRALRVTVVRPVLEPTAEALVFEPPGAARQPEPLDMTKQAGSQEGRAIPRLERRGDGRAVLVEADGRRRRVSFGPERAGRGSVELVVDGWLVELVVETERRAGLRERATAVRAATRAGGATEVRAMIPGRVVSVSVVAGQAVHAGQQLLVVEAMKMQNELRAPRDGTVTTVAVEPGMTVEIGDSLVVIG